MAHTSELHKVSLPDVEFYRCEQLELAICNVWSFKPGKNSDYKHLRCDTVQSG